MSILLTPYDLYCERLHPGFWAEPVNALSNAGFLVAAFMAWRLARTRPGALNGQTWVLITLTAIIGAGSFLFHTLAVLWAMLTDVIPIGLYQLLCLAFYARSVAGWSKAGVAGYVGAYLALSLALAITPDRWFNGSLPYGSALAAVLFMGVYHLRAGKREPYVLLWASLALIGSLACRVADMHACAFWSMGTHAGWHLLNAVVLYLTTRGFVMNLPPTAQNVARVA